VLLNAILGSLSCFSFALLIWQWLAARRFPLHQRAADKSFAPPLTLLKSLKGADAATEDCLRSWFTQEYNGGIQILFAVASAEDPVCGLVEKLARDFPKQDVQLVICPRISGANAKVSKLAELEKLARHDLLVISDADVRVSPDFLANTVAPLRAPETGLINCFYRLANPATLAMQWEAIAINADFWSQVLQSQTLKPLDFALGAVMLTRRQCLAQIGGFKSLADCLADDYQLGNRIARQGHRIVLSPVVVECWDPPMTWRAVWHHQLRWARTIRACQPAPYFLSILSNAGFWALLWFLFGLAQSIRTAHLHLGLLGGALFVLARMGIVSNLQRRLNPPAKTLRYLWLVPIKDILQTAIWLFAFAGNRIEWRGQAFKLRRDGTLVKINAGR
jgi:ceramide glucosyltransferase